MIKLKIRNGNHYVSYVVDEKIPQAIIMEENYNETLKAIFGDRNDFENLESWTCSRVGNKDFDTAIKIIRKNHGKSVKDHFELEVTDLAMRLPEVESYFGDKENANCPLTNELIQSGYKQKRDGYVTYLRNKGWTEEKIYHQYNHLIYSWVEQFKLGGEPNARFRENTTCGELLFWMAEVSHAVDEQELKELKSRVLAEFHAKKATRGELNKEIKRVCFARTVYTVLSATKGITV